MYAAHIAADFNVGRSIDLYFNGAFSTIAPAAPDICAHRLRRLPGQ
jgi:hypothetical protein